MHDGGWVATHEDITDKIETESAIKKQKEQLDAALAHISQGVCMFDASKRLIICNKQYADIYELTEELTKPGTPFQAILEHTVAKGNGPKDLAAYLKARLNDVAGRVPYQTTNKLRDGRYVAVVHRPMANGGWVATHQDITEARHREEPSAAVRRQPRADVGDRPGDAALPRPSTRPPSPIRLYPRAVHGDERGRPAAD